ncbi:MAG: DUF445 family protein [Lentisphaeria bacterium]|nr:DUF445 family protein [Lentisphaeria bacterium]
MSRFLEKLQSVLSPVSWITILAIPAKAVTGWSGPEWFSFWVFPVMVAAAVGYLTNFIAIEMLFKPYERTGFHWLRLLSLGLWKQGMVPANKAKIGHVLGEEIPERLLKPEEISREIGERLSAMTADPALLEQIRAAVQLMLRKNEESVIRFLIPRLETSLAEALDCNLTPANLRVFWDEVIEKHLASPAMREKLAAGIVAGLRTRTPEFRELLREFLRDGVKHYVNDRLAFIPRSGEIAAGIVNHLNWNDIEQQIAAKLEDERIHGLIGDELAMQTVRLREWLHSDDAAPQLQGFLDGTRARLGEFLHAYLSESVPQVANQILSSDDLWNWIRTELLPALQRYLDYWMARDGRRIIIRMLDLNNRIEQSIANQNVREFHAMINRIAAEHLGMIQVLGYALGAIVGTLQQLAALLAR